MTHGFGKLLIAAVFWGLMCPAMANNQVPVVGQPAPNFKLTTFDGQHLTLADFKGQVLVLNFWATWCGPCKRELPLLEGYFRIMQPAGLRILAIATEDSLSPFQLRPLAKELTMPMVKRFKGDYGQIKVLPTNIVIDRAGVIRYARAGAFTEYSIQEIIRPLLREGTQDNDVAETN
jgi:cytochrome c biogenesis protein CcmG, thiol:disulfide interchange protein DsbE